MHITIINDCRDANAAGRQTTRAVALIGGSASFIGVANALEAAGNLIDALDAYGDAPGAVLVNVAPRDGTAKKWENGTPFGYFWRTNVLVVASIDGLTLSLVKKLKLVELVNVLDIVAVTDRFVEEGVLARDIADRVVRTQFRSYEFVPRVAAYLLKNKDVVSEQMSIANFSDAPKAVWWIDNFGNCKTTVLPEEIPMDVLVQMAFGEVPYFSRLKDVPDGQIALVTGSSGIGTSRFLEIVAQGKSAAQLLGLSSGEVLR